MNMNDASQFVEMLNRSNLLQFDAKSRRVACEAWQLGLSDVAYDEARTALSGILQETTSGQRITPGDVRARVLRARERTHRPPPGPPRRPSVRPRCARCQRLDVHPVHHADDWPARHGFEEAR
jgi:hypothetical protein